jgi:hypothetical protein
MQSTLSPVSLKTALRKSRLLIFSLLLLLIPLDAVSQQLEVRTVRSSDSLIFVDCRLTSLDEERLLGALDRGDTVQVGLRFRGGGPGLLESGVGAPLSALRRRARWDRIEKLYVIDRDGQKSYFLHKDALLSELLVFRDVPLRTEEKKSGTFVQGEIQWRILNPPLNILSPFLPSLRSRTEWTEIPLRHSAQGSGGAAAP